MTTPNLVILYVTDVPRAATFWGGLFGTTPVEAAETFAMLPMREGMMLGLWKIDGVAPMTMTKTATLGGGGELCAALASREAVDALHAEWLARGVPVLQSPTTMDFGYTFTAGDPDGHRIRVFHPAG